MDASIILNAWRDFLYIRKDNIGDKYFAVDQAIMHSSHSQVRELMQTQPQLRGNDLGIIRILAPSYLLDNPLSLGTNGNEHTGLWTVILQALPEPSQKIDFLGNLVEQSLSEAAKQGKLHIGNDLPKIILSILHQLVFQISLSEEEITASNNYIKGLVLASLPNFISKYLLAILTAPKIRHRQYLTNRYKQSTQWDSITEVKWSFEKVTAVTPNNLVLQGFAQ
ncbi:cytochrome P450 family protein [Nostoc sphaeroides]|uniref:hypothetical protein n=1 Tax=Nostoc sphaeroides TaxID=446679 RepID=UPI002B3FFE50|nr:hypothetical protein [Nostoc sphaeroides]